MTTRVVLSISALAALTTTFVPAPWNGYVTLAVVGLVASAIVISNISTGLRVLLGGGFMGLGLAIVIAGVQTASEQLLVGVLFGAFGVLVIGAGVIFSIGHTGLTNDRHYARESNFDKVSPVDDREVHLNVRQPPWLSIPMFGAGLLLITAGVLSPRKSSDSALIYVGLLFLGIGVEGFTKRGIVRTLAIMFIGFSIFASGVAYVVIRSFLPGAAQIAIGLAFIGVANLWFIKGGQWKRLRRRWSYLAGTSPYPGDDQH
ncbi:hypothetical protein KIF24_20320 [Micromonospora sp. Llam7]|uniref:hypothetical protein n=1 Tax=Micromonospora tarapacensis TaxID=2835305 RepID=UPI001C835D7B|nr:hypothetical protein [Micromonospora tarapacensis]MBX7268150.1 hypothetical protein [Micromonospora tarapacensis]